LTAPFSSRPLITQVRSRDGIPNFILVKGGDLDHIDGVRINCAMRSGLRAEPKMGRNGTTRPPRYTYLSNLRILYISKYNKSESQYFFVGIQAKPEALLKE
jgi:hypothetical protein